MRPSRNQIGTVLGGVLVVALGMVPALGAGVEPFPSCNYKFSECMRYVEYQFNEVKKDPVGYKIGTRACFNQYEKCLDEELAQHPVSPTIPETRVTPRLPLHTISGQ